MSTTSSIGSRAAAVLLLIVAAACGGAPGATDQQPGAEAPGTYVYVGTYTRDTGSAGVYRLRLDETTGALSEPEVAAEVENPSFLAVHPGHRVLYAVSETRGTAERPGGTVSGYSIGPDGVLTPINVESTGAGGPCYVATTADGSVVLVANYSGSIASLPAGSDGRLAPAATFLRHEGSSVHPRRQRGPHAHSINVDPSGRFALAADLGLDRVLVYRIGQTDGTLTPHDPPSAAVSPGSGPRHLAFHPGGRTAYLINELTNTITVFDWDAEAGTLSERQTIPTLPEDFTGTSYTAEVQVHPSGRFVYGSNRGHDSLAIFAVNPGTGTLTAVGHESTDGARPRHFGIDPTGTFLIAANQDTGNLVVFRIDQETGRLTRTGVTATVPSPVCVRFVQAGRG